MYRPLSILLVGQAFADGETGALMQNQGGAEYSALHREFTTMTDSSRDSAQKLAQMQVTARKMESEYRQLLEQAVRDPNTGTPWLPNVAKLMEQQFLVLQNELEQEQSANQLIVNQTNAVIVACNTDMQDSLDNEVSNLKSVTSDVRGQHNACRTVEKNTLAARDENCIRPSVQNSDNPSVTAADAVKEGFASDTKSGKAWIGNGWGSNHEDFDFHNRSHENQAATVCKGNQDFFAQFAAAAWSGDSYASGQLVAIIEQANACATSLEHGKDCDQKQKQFEADFCLFSQALRDTCSTHTSCWEAAVDARKTTLLDINKLEAAQKQVWIALKKIQCYVGHLVNLQETKTQPTLQSITDCTELKPDTSALDINKGDPATWTKAVCDDKDVKYQPGDAEWKLAEYEDFGFWDQNTGSHYLDKPWKRKEGRTYNYANYYELEKVTSCAGQVGATIDLNNHESGTFDWAGHHTSAYDRHHSGQNTAENYQSADNDTLANEGTPSDGLNRL
jgi:hypothetical protein